MSGRAWLVLALALAAAPPAWGHGIGAETLPAQELGGRMAIIEASITAADTGQLLRLEMLYEEPREPVRGVTYYLEASRHGKPLFADTFEAGSGILEIGLVPGESSQLSRDAGFFGAFDGVARATASGPGLDGGGLYDMAIRTEAAGEELEWRAGVSVADTRGLDVYDPLFGAQNITHISYYDTVQDLAYDPEGPAIRFSMPFDTSTISQTDVVHEEVAVPKTLGTMMASEMSLRLNGQEMPSWIVQVDDLGEDRVIHATVFREELGELFDGGHLEDRLHFELGPARDGLPLSTVTRNGQYEIFMEADPPVAVPGQELEIRYRFADAFLKDRPVGADHGISVGGGLFSARGTSSDDGSYESVRLAVPAEQAGVMDVRFDRLGGNELASAVLPVAVAALMPSWVRDAAAAWAGGDGEAGFAAAAGYMAYGTDGRPAQDAGVPGWTRGTAGLWADGAISDAELGAAMAYLVRSGAIQT